MDVLTNGGPDRCMAYNRQTDAWPTTDRCMDVLTDRGMDVYTDRGPDRRMAYNRQTHGLQQIDAWPITDRRMAYNR